MGHYPEYTCIPLDLADVHLYGWRAPTMALSLRPLAAKILVAQLKITTQLISEQQRY